MSKPTKEEIRAARENGLRGDALKNEPWMGQGEPGPVDQWRVTGQPTSPKYSDYNFPLYDFSWYGPEAEMKARSFLMQPSILDTFDDLKLTHRVVTYGEWTDKEFDVEDLA